MQTTWRVTEIHATEGQTKATLRRVDWWKRNPAYADIPFDDDEMHDDEFVDALPGEETAEFSETVDSLTIDITKGLDLKPGANIVMLLDVAEVSIGSLIL